MSAQAKERANFFFFNVKPVLFKNQREKSPQN